MKNKTIAFFLALICGSIGAHKFYLGDKQKGLLYLIFFWTYIPFILGVFEAIKIIKMTDDEFHVYQNTYLDHKEKQKKNKDLEESQKEIGSEKVNKPKKEEKRSIRRKWDREKIEFKFIDLINVAIVPGENLTAYNYKGKRAFKISKSARENAYNGFYAIGKSSPSSSWRKVPDAYLLSFNNESFKDNMSKLGYENLEWINDLGMKYIEFQKDERVNLFEKDIKDKAAEAKRKADARAAEAKRKADARAAEAKRKAAAEAAEAKRIALKKELIEEFGEFGTAIFNGIIKKGMSKKMVMKCDQLSSRGPALKKDNEWYYNKATASFGFDTILQFQGDVVDKVKNPKDVDGIWLDMTKQELTLACGKPDKKGNKSVSRAKVTEIWKFFGRTNRQNTTSYKWEVRLVNDIVDSWKELE